MSLTLRNTKGSPLTHSEMDANWRAAAFTVTAISDLKALNTDSQSGAVVVLGYNSANDGGGGIFQWNSSSALADDGGMVIAPTVAASTGRWIRQVPYFGFAQPEWFGSKPNDATTNAIAVQRCCNMLAKAAATISGADTTVPYNPAGRTGGVVLLTSTQGYNFGTQDIQVPAYTDIAGIETLSVTAFWADAHTGKGFLCQDYSGAVSSPQTGGTFIRDLDITAGASSTYVVYNEGPNQECGLKRVQLRNINQGGAFFGNTGGPARCVVDQVHITAGTVASLSTRRGLVLNPAISSVTNVDVEGSSSRHFDKAIQVTAGELIATNVHFENGVAAAGDGISLEQTDGSPNSIDGVQVNSTFTGNVVRIVSTFVGSVKARGIVANNASGVTVAVKNDVTGQTYTNKDITSYEHTSDTHAQNPTMEVAQDMRGDTNGYNLFNTAGTNVGQWGPAKFWSAGRSANDVALGAANNLFLFFNNSNTTGIEGIVNYGWLVLGSRFQTPQGANLTAANNLVLGTDGNYFQVDGATQINLISNNTWVGGAEVTLKFNSTPTVKHNQAASGVNRPIILNGAADLVAAASNTLTLRYDATDDKWYEQSRKV